MTPLTLSAVIEAIESGDARLVVERVDDNTLEIAVEWHVRPLGGNVRDVLVKGTSLLYMAPEIMRLAR
jgi:hypothetical protein